MTGPTPRITSYNVCYTKLLRGGYTVTVPALPGCISEGDSRDEALANIAEAIQLYLEPVEDDALRNNFV